MELKGGREEEGRGRESGGREGGEGSERVGDGRNIAVSKILHLSETEKLNIAQTCAEVILL